MGAGKTSAVTKFAAWLNGKGLRVGLVANDQGVGLVDGLRMGRARAVPLNLTREITGGCFCCKADELMATLRELNEAGRPEVILAEPVGSCTDLVATVVRPLEQVYAAGYRMAPMSVVVDVLRLRGSGPAALVAPEDEDAHESPRNREGTIRSAVPGFSAAVSYIYQKQMEEAGVLVLNKVDLLSKQQRTEVSGWVREKFLEKTVLEVSTKTGEGLEAWFEHLLNHEHWDAGTLELDYDLYAEGEALLGWYNAELSVHGVRGAFDGNRLLRQLAQEVQAALELAGAGIAHFKMSLERSHAVDFPAASGPLRKAGRRGPQREHPRSDLGIVQVAAQGMRPELTETLESDLVVGKLLVNLRAEAEPAVLAEAVRTAMRSKAVRFVWLERAAFKPGRPAPVHRLDARGKQQLPKKKPTETERILTPAKDTKRRKTILKKAPHA